MPATKKSTILKRIEKLSARNADPIKLAVALANLDADKSSSPNMAELMLITQKSRRTLSYLRSIGKRLGDLGIAERNLVNIAWTKGIEIASRTRELPYRQPRASSRLALTLTRFRAINCLHEMERCFWHAVAAEDRARWPRKVRF